MQNPLIESLETQKLGVFGESESAKAAMKYAIDNLPDSPSGLVTAAIMNYHNTLITEIQNMIRRESHGQDTDQ